MPDAPVLILRPATMSDGSLFPLLNLWWPEAPDGRFMPELTTRQCEQLAAAMGWQIQIVAS